MGLRFLHLADLDLGARHEALGDLAEERDREVLDTFRGAVSFALDPARRVDAVLVTGNLFDRHRPDPELWGFVRGLLGRLAAARKPVVLVPGCRDGYGYKDSVYRTERLPGVTLLTAAAPGVPTTLEIGGQAVHVYGVANQAGLTPAPFPGFRRTAEPGVHLGMLCAAIPDHPEWEVRPRDLVVDADVLAASGLDFVAMGGYHQHTVLRLEGTTVVYAGTLEGRDFRPGDLGRKGLTLIDVEDGEVAVSEEPISRRRLESWDIDLRAEGVTDPEGLVCALLGRADRDAIVRVTLAGPLEFLCDLEEVRQRVREHFHHVEIVDGTDLLGSGLLRRLQAESTIRGFFVRRLLARIEELQDRAGPGATAVRLDRELEVARRALKIGLENFVEPERAEVLYPSATPAAARRPAAEGAAREAQGVNGAATSGPKARVRALLRQEREHAGPAIEGEASA